MVRCLNDTQCSRCMSAMNATRGFPHTISEYSSMNLAEIRAYHVGFFETLLSTAACSTNATPPGILQAALQELDNSHSFNDALRMVIDTCALVEYV